MGDEFEQLHASAEAAMGMLQRLAGEGGVLPQIAAGEWDRDLSPTRARDLNDLIRSLHEHARDARATAGMLNVPDKPDDGGHYYAARSLSHMCDRLLPLNRKERFYTGTVLPAIVAHDGFAHLDRLLRLCGIDANIESQQPREGLQDFQFFTEYNFAESLFTDRDRLRFPDAPLEGDTPDLVLCGTDWLVAIEAKMFHRPTRAALTEQIQRQNVLVQYWASSLGMAMDRCAHVLLLPGGQLATGRGVAPVVTWQEIFDQYRMVGPAYWIGLLQTALDRYDDLMSKETAFGINADSHLIGAEIRRRQRDGSLEYTYMGRKGGLTGEALKLDLASGRWLDQRYEVRVDPLESINWFPSQPSSPCTYRTLVVPIPQRVSTLRDRGLVGLFAC